MIPYIYQKLGYIEKEWLLTLIYLCDWKSVLKYGKPITNTKWVRSIYGLPITKDRCIDENCLNKEVSNKLYLEIADFVINTYKSLTLSEFVRLIQSTYPMFYNEPHGEIDFTKDNQGYARWRNKDGQL